MRVFMDKVDNNKGNKILPTANRHTIDPFLHREILREVLDNYLLDAFASEDKTEAEYFGNLSKAFEKLRIITGEKDAK